MTGRAEVAAAVTDPAQLPEPLRAPARRLLAAYGKAMAARGYGPDHVARSVRHLLLKIAYYSEVPETVEDVHSRWPWRTDIEMVEAIRGHGPDTFGRAMELIEGRPPPVRKGAGSRARRRHPHEQAQ